MFKVISSYTKTAQTGYLAKEYCRTPRKWEDIEKERAEIISQAIKKAEDLASKQGHKMGAWSNINSSHCEKCQLEAKITDIFDKFSTKFKGPIFEQPCSHQEYTSRDKWHWSMSNVETV